MALITQLDEHLFELNSPKGVLGHRMTIVRVPESAGGGLWLHSPVEYSDALWDELDALSTGNDTRHLIIPSRTHDLYLEPWMQRIPAQTTYAPPALQKAHPKWDVGQILTPTFEAPWSTALPHVCLMGAPRVSEVAFLDQASNTLILVDSVFAISGQESFLVGLFLRLNGCKEPVCTSRLFRFLTKDKPAFRASLAQILEWNFERVLVGHGRVIEGSQVAQLREHLESL